jgi:hypothetical protein
MLAAMILPPTGVSMKTRFPGNGRI